jgi:hypothetical protein
MWRRPVPAAAHLVVLLTVGVALVLLMSVQTAHADGNIVSVTITVQNGLGEPLPNANVTAYYRDNSSKVPNTGGREGSKNTTSTGQAVLKLFNGTSGASYVINVTYVTYGVKLSKILNLECDPKCTSASLSLSVNLDVYHLTIKVLSSAGDPVQGAKINVTSSSTDPNAIATNQPTGSDGTLVVRNLPAGIEYSIAVSYTAVGNVKVTGSTTFTLSADNRITEIRLPLYRLSMKVQDMDGNAISGATVELLKDGGTLLSLNSGTDGLVTFKLLPGGTYSLRFKIGSEQVDERRDLVLSGDRDLGELTLPVRKLSLLLRSLNDKPLTGFQLTVKLIYGGSDYRSAGTSTDSIDFGYVRADRDYTLKVLFEGHTVYEGRLRGDDIRTNLPLKLNFGNFGISLNLDGLFGNLPRLLRSSVNVKLTVEGGSFSLERLLSDASTLITDHPLVPYRYQLLYLGSVIGEGTLRPQRNGDLLIVRPETLDLNLRLLSLEGRPVSGTLVISIGNAEVGRVQLAAEGGRVQGLVPLSYSYRAIYMGVQVAEGEISRDALRSGSVELRVRVLDLTVRVLDYDGEVPLEGALVALQVGGYRDLKTTNATGQAVFSNVPYSKANVTVRYKGVEVYGAEVEYRLEEKSVMISKTRVFRVHLNALTGEKSPLPEGRYVIEIGEFRSEGELDEQGRATVRLVPGGIVKVTVYFKGVLVRQSEEKVDEQDERLELATKVFTRAAEVLYLDLEGNRKGLGGVRVEYRLKGSNELIANVTTDDRGRAVALLPASEYVVVYSYLGVEVSRKEVSHMARLEEEVELPVYEVSYRVLDVEGSPVGNLTATFLLLQQKGGFKQVLKQHLDPSGAGTAIIPAGKYLVRFNSTSWTQEAGLEVNGPGTRNIALVPQRTLQGGVPYIVSAALVAVAAIGILKSLSIRRGAGGRVRSEEVTGGAEGRPAEKKAREHLRRRVRRNI